jgi:hypothetical protein
MGFAVSIQCDIGLVATFRAKTVEFRVPSAQAIEQIIVFIRTRYKHIRIHEEHGSTNIPFSARTSADP